MNPPFRRTSLLVLLLAASLLLVPQAQAQSSTAQVPHTVRLSDASSLQFYLRWTSDRQPLISAHRGGPEAGYPENCIETFDHVLTYFPCLIELDVAQTADSMLVLMHDDTLGRTMAGQGHISDLYFDDIRSRYLIDPTGDTTVFHTPTLGEVLDWARGRAVLTVDVKRSIRPGKIVDTINEHDARGYAVVITYNANQAIAYHHLDPDLVLSVNIRNEEDLQRLVDAGIPIKNMIAFVGITEADKALYDLLHGKGIRCILGTMGNPDRRAAAKGIGIYEDLYRHGADVLSTNNVPAVTKAIEELKNPPKPKPKPKTTKKSSKKRK
ncbi:MAG: glycerophosphodiester phosphodiesterase family protein [bacterium]